MRLFHFVHTAWVLQRECEMLASTCLYLLCAYLVIVTRWYVCRRRQEAELQQLITLHDHVSGLPKSNVDVPRLRNQLFYLSLVMFVRSMHCYVSAIEPSLVGSKFISWCPPQLLVAFSCVEYCWVQVKIQYDVTRCIYVSSVADSSMVNLPPRTKTEIITKAN